MLTKEESAKLQFAITIFNEIVDDFGDEFEDGIEELTIKALAYLEEIHLKYHPWEKKNDN